MTEMLLTAYDGAILGPIAKVLGWLMNGIYYLMTMVGLENISLAIILFTIVIYALMFPFTYKQQKFSMLQQKMAPELQAINKKYNGKKDQASMMAMQEETQAVYEKYGVSMMGSCGQMLITMPLLFSLYYVFQNVPAYVTRVKSIFTPLVDGIVMTPGFQDKMTKLVTDLRIYTRPMADFTLENTVENAERLSNYVTDVLYKMNSTGWDQLKGVFPDLSAEISSTYETVSHVNNLFGMNISDTPWQIIKFNFAEMSNGFEIGALLMLIGALMIPVISYLSQILNMKLMPQASGGNDQADAMAQQMKMMNRIMPLFSFVMCFTVPVGLGIYWIGGAVVRSVQQVLLNRHFKKVNLEDIIKKNQEKMKKKREKMGIAENQISNAARMNTKKIAEPQTQKMSSAEREKQLEKATAAKQNAKAGSMAAKANMVREFNERNSRK